MYPVDVVGACSCNDKTEGEVENYSKRVGGAKQSIHHNKFTSQASKRWKVGKGSSVNINGSRSKAGLHEGAGPSEWTIHSYKKKMSTAADLSDE